MKLKLEAETLSDGSRVYNVFLDQMTFPAVDRLAARKCADLIYRAITDYTNETVEVVFSDNFHDEYASATDGN